MKSKLLVFLLLAAAVCACGTSHDGPPKGNGPEPEPLSGVFSGNLGKMTFNGDGSTVAVSLTGKAAALCPEGTMEYAFTYGARGLCRYDVADRLVLSKDGQNYLFFVHKADGAVLELSKDGIELFLAKQGMNKESGRH